MFIQPFIENAIEHGFEGNQYDKISITIAQTEAGKRLQITIENNGKAYSTTSIAPKVNHKSLSGQILKERLAIYSKAYKLKSYFTIDDLKKDVSGTRVKLYLPLIKDV